MRNIKLIGSGIIILIVVIVGIFRFSLLSQTTTHYTVLEKDEVGNKIIAANPSGEKVTIKVDEAYIDLIKRNESYMITFASNKWREPNIIKISLLQ